MISGMALAQGNSQWMALIDSQLKELAKEDESQYSSLESRAQTTLGWFLGLNGLVGAGLIKTADDAMPIVRHMWSEGSIFLYAVPSVYVATLFFALHALKEALRVRLYHSTSFDVVFPGGTFVPQNASEHEVYIAQAKWINHMNNRDILNKRAMHLSRAHWSVLLLLFLAPTLFIPLGKQSIEGEKSVNQVQASGNQNPTPQPAPTPAPAPRPIPIAPQPSDPLKKSK
jgi:hypothetical protein